MITINQGKAKACKLKKINDACDEEISVIKVTYPEAEVLSWDKQEREAYAIQADHAAITPLVDSIAASRGLDRLELANRIIIKSQEFAALSGAAIGKRQKLEDQINAATTIDQLNDIAW